MSLLVKICGLSTRETLDTALEAGADMVGFVFFPPSPWTNRERTSTERQPFSSLKGPSMRPKLLLSFAPGRHWTAIFFPTP